MDRQSKESTLLGVKMIVFFFAALLFQLSCARGVETVVRTQAPGDDDGLYARVLVNGFTLSLKLHNGKCVLYYKTEGNDGGEKSEILDIAPPCNFVREPQREAPLVYTYGEAASSKHVVVVTGGPPKPGVKDKFQPDGCGTEIQAVGVFDREVKIMQRGDAGAGAVCPSGGLDETFYAAATAKDPSSPPDNRYNDVRAPQMWKERPELVERSTIASIASEMASANGIMFIGDETIKRDSWDQISELPGVRPDFFADFKKKNEISFKLKDRFDSTADIRLLKVKGPMESELQNIKKKYANTEGIVLFSRGGMSPDLSQMLIYVESYKVGGSVEKKYCLVSWDFDTGEKTEKWLEAH
jgi:hypothetical protein